MKIISVLNQKGGCGKTITSVNLAAGLSRLGKKVLLIDLDPQAHATFALGKNYPLTITDILENFAAGKLIEEIPFDEMSIAQNFYFLSSSLGLAAVEQNLAAAEDKLEILESFLNTISGQFDFCIIDCPPNLGLLTLNAAQAAAYAVIPINTCDFALRGIEILKDILIMLKEYSGHAPAPFYLLSQYDSRSKYAQEFSRKLKQNLGELLLNSSIRANVHLKEAASLGKDIFTYKSDSRGAEDFAGLAAEIETIVSGKEFTPLFFKADSAENVYVVGDFNNWEKNLNYRLKRISREIWGINLALEKGDYRYKFVADDAWLTDPYNKLTEKDPFGGINSLLHVK